MLEWISQNILTRIETSVAIEIQRKKISEMVVLQVPQTIVMSLKKDEPPEFKEILFNWLRNMQEKVAQIYNLVQDTRNIQIKGGKQLEELESYVQVTSSKFDEYKKHQK